MSNNVVCGKSTILPCNELASAIKSIAKAVPIVGFSNKIRDGRVRVYVEKVPSPAITAPLKTLTVNGKDFEVEFFVMGKVKPLDEK